MSCAGVQLEGRLQFEIAQRGPVYRRHTCSEPIKVQPQNDIRDRLATNLSHRNAVIEEGRQHLSRILAEVCIDNVIELAGYGRVAHEPANVLRLALDFYNHGTGRQRRVIIA